MAAPCPHIKVHALLPPPVTPTTPSDSKIDLANWDWAHCLTLPLETLNSHKFSRRPYKWIRYAMGVVLGAEGVLATSCHSDPMIDEVDYEAAAISLPAACASYLNLYYHTSDEERRRMFPADPQIANGHSDSDGSSRSSSSVLTEVQSFNDEVAQRDGRSCVVIHGLPEEFCDATHLLSCSKGDTYISTYTRHRSRDPTGKDVIEDINSIRNGLFLSKYLHSGLGIDVAFLPTPNFAMTTTDIDPTADPTEKRWTFHLFKEVEYLPPSGSQARIHDTPQYPPAILFDAVYASTVQHHFGTQTLKDTIAVVYNDAFYPVVIAPVIDEDERRAAIAARKLRHAQARALRGPDTMDMLMMITCSMHPIQPAEQARLREAQEKAEAEEQERVRDKVSSWMSRVDNP